MSYALDPDWFNKVVLQNDYAPSLKSLANPYQTLQGLAGTTPLTTANWRQYAGQYDQGHPIVPSTGPANNSGGVWNQPPLPGRGPGGDGSKPPVIPVTPPAPPVPVSGRSGADNGGAGGIQPSITPIGGGGSVGGSVGGVLAPSLSLSPVTSPDQGRTTGPDYPSLFRGFDGNVVDAGPSVSLGDGAQPQSQAGGVDYQGLFKGFDGTTVGYDATTYDPNSAQWANMPTPQLPGGIYMSNQTNVPQVSSVFPTGPNMAGGGLNLSATGAPDPNSAYPPGSVTLGQSMDPWLTPYQGQFTAPMSAEQGQGLQGISNFVGGGENLGGAQGYLNNVLSGQYLSPSTNPNIQPYLSSLSGIHDYQDQLERERIGSSMAAGGNALSGARASAEEQYQNESNNQYQNQIASFLNSNYQNERGLQNSAVPLQMGLSNEMLGGNQALMQAGAVPQQLSQNDLNAQYGDYLRQIAGMQQSYNAPMQEMQQLLQSGGYKGSYQQQYGPSASNTWASLLAALAGGGGGGLGGLLGSTGSGGSGGGGLLGALSSLFGGGSSSGAPNGLQPDGSSLYDPTNPYGFSMNGSDLSSLFDQSGIGAGGYDPNNPYGGDYNGIDPSMMNEILNTFGFDSTQTGNP